MICDDTKLMAAVVIGVHSVTSSVFYVAHLRQSLKSPCGQVPILEEGTES